MSKELDVSFPPSGNWLVFDKVPLNHQPPDLLMQLLEYFFVFNGVIEVDVLADFRPAPVLMEQLRSRLREIREKGDEIKGG